MDLRTALEDAIFADPDDLAAHMAYADHLHELGDPRGEFIQTQLALEDPACQGGRRDDLLLLEMELLEAHQRDWLGPLASVILDQEASEYLTEHNFISRVSWRRGWLDEVYLWWAGTKEVRALKACPIARVLARLDLHNITWHEAGEVDEELLPNDNVPEDEDYTSLYVLLDAPFLPQLRWLRIGEAADFEGEGMYNNEGHGEGLIGLLRKTPRLEELHAHAYNLDLPRLFALDCLRSLRVLVVYNEHEEYPLDVLAANAAFPALERLRLHPAHGGRYGRSYLTRPQLDALFRTQQLPALKHLHVHGSDLGDEGCADLVASGMLRRLETLDLRFGCVTDDGARTLAECPDLRHLHHLSIANNQLTEVGIKALRATGIDVRADGQYDAGSDEYLWTGDME